MSSVDHQHLPVPPVPANLAKGGENEEGVNSTSAATAWPVSRVRSTFIEYFVKKRDHVFFPSSPVVPVNDPTLLFANSGKEQYFYIQLTIHVVYVLLLLLLLLLLLMSRNDAV